MARKLAITVVAVATTLALPLGAAPGIDPAPASAASCRGVTLKPAVKKVRRGGRVLLLGRICGAGASSAAGTKVKLKIRSGRRWRRFAKVRADASGRYSACVRIRTRRRTKKVRLRAVASNRGKATTKLRVLRKKGSRKCKTSKPGASTSLSVLREDLATNPDPMPLWNSIDAEDPSRHQRFASGGPDGGPFRRMTVVDGDDHWGERAELGYNSRLNGLGAPWGTFFLYQAGKRHLTRLWVRLPTGFPISTSSWQVVLQMKQTGPASNSGGTPVLALEARNGNWVLTQSDSPGPSSTTHELWSTPATLGVWVPVSIDATYSPDRTRGRVQISVGKGESATFSTYTQKYEISPPQQGLTVGGPIPSHLRIGIYHKTSLPGTHVDFADVQVLG